MNLKISSNWDFIKTFPELIADAKFIFLHKSYSGERLKLVVNTPIEKFDCFEIGYDRYGLTIEADTIFSNGWGEMIEDSSKDYERFITEYLLKEGATDLIIKQ